MARYSETDILNDVYDSSAHALKTTASGSSAGGSSSITNLPTTVDTNSGNKSASTIRVVIATDQPAFTTPIPTLEQARATTSSNVNIPASNTAAVITIAAAGASISNVIGGVAWSYNSTPTGGNLKIEDGSGTTVFSVDITSAGPGFIPFARPLKGTANTALIITLASGGSGVSGKVNVLSRWTE